MSSFDAMFETIVSRKEYAEEGSYTGYLFNKGKEKILKKCGEECSEVLIAAMKNDKEETINEINDLFYHIFVLMAEMDISMEDVTNEMDKRSAKTNNFKGERKKVENY